jgi:parallel beta-helix repeat protein
MTTQPRSALLTRANAVRTSVAMGAVTPSIVGALVRDVIDSTPAVGSAPGVSLSASEALATTTAVQSAITTLGASTEPGIIDLPAGTYYLDEGSVLGDVCLQFGADVSNVWLRGAGEGVTVLKLKDSGAAHVVNLDGASNIKITDLTIDGNRANNTGTSWHGIRTGASGITGLTIERVTVRNTRGYGLGLQGGDKKRVRISNVTCEDTGLDGCDFKNTTDNSEDIVIEAYSVRRWGLDLSVTEQAGLDCRGPCQVSGVWASEGPADGHYIRIREGETVDSSLGGHYSHLTNFVCEGNSGATSIGVYIAAHDCSVSGGYVKDFLLGVNLQGERNNVFGVTAESCDDESFQVNVDAENCRITDCHSLSATHSGFRIRAPRCKMVACSSGGDLVSGLVTEATATGFQSTGFDCEGTGGVMEGISIASADATIIGGDISGCFRGFSTVAARSKFIAVYSHGNTDDGGLISTGGDDSLVSGCSLVNNTDDGLTLRADNCRILSNVITGNTGTGLDIIVGADNNVVDGNRFNGNGTAMGDAGAGNRFGANNSGLSTPYLMNSIRYLAGTGSPEGVHAAPVGSQYARTDGGAATCLYIKESGAGNTGWVAK